MVWVFTLGCMPPPNPAMFGPCELLWSTDAGFRAPSNRRQPVALLIDPMLASRSTGMSPMSEQDRCVSC
jgi:hypothetical protein